MHKKAPGDAGVVKLRKGESAKLMATVKSMPALYRTFLRMADDMVARSVAFALQLTPSALKQLSQ